MPAILTGTSVAATAIAPATLRVYFQDDSGGIREGTYPTPGSASGWGVTANPIFTAKLFTPLAVISWNDGKQVQIRIYSLTVNNTIQEYCYPASGGTGWTSGYLSNSKFPAAPNSSLSAVQWAEGSGVGIRVYAQDPSTDAIQEYCNGNPWTKGSTLPVALRGSSISAVGWLQNGIHLRVYYQEPGHTLKEHAWDGSWYVGGFNPGLAPVYTPISAVAWFDSSVKIRVFWEDINRNLVGVNWLGGWSSVAKVTGPLVGVQVSAIQWNNGTSIRVYYEGASDDVLEQATDGGSWYSGQGVAVTSGGQIKPR